MLRNSWLLSAMGVLVGVAGFVSAQSTGTVKCDSFNGAVLVKKQGDRWKTIQVGDEVAPGSLIVSLPKAVFLSSNGAVEMRLLADIGQRGPYPVLETAVTVNKNDDVDIDVSFDRGIVVLMNRKKAGSATASVRFRDQVWNLTLKKPNTRVGLEIYSRHMPGLPTIKDGKAPPPVTYVVLLVGDGEAYLDTGDLDFTLHAPPGPARIHWDSVSRVAAVDRLQQLPEGITRGLTKEEEQLFHDICACAGKLKDREPGPLLDLFVESESKTDRLVGVTAMGAIDDLPRLTQALSNPKHADVRRQAVLVLRHWMGRGPGQAEALYKSLQEASKHSDVQARTVLQLLFGFSDRDRFDPITYDLLTAFLAHPQLAVRELAHWHLVRLMPEGKSIAFDAAAPEAERQQAVRQWQTVINKSGINSQGK